MSMIKNLEAMLEKGQDSPLLRLSLGNAYLSEGDSGTAAVHLAEAVRQKPDYSAAWKAYGKALVEAGRDAEAESAYVRGIEVAEANGDKQAVKEMSVFLKRLRR